MSPLFGTFETAADVRYLAAFGGKADCRTIAIYEYAPLEDDAPLARLLGQNKLLHLRAHLVRVPAKEARGLCNRPAVVEFVLEVVLSISDQDSPEFASIGHP